MARMQLKAQLESYALIPTILALAIVGVDRSELHWAFKIVLLVIVAGYARVATCWTEATASLVLAIVLEHGLFFHPLVSFGAAVALGIGLLLVQPQPTELARRALFIGPVYVAGAFALVGHPIMRWGSTVAVLAALTTTAWFVVSGRLRYSDIAINSAHYLAPELGTGERNPNRDRYSLHCIYFLALGSCTWGQFTELLDYRFATLLHFSISTVVPVAFFSILRIPFHEIDYAETAPVRVTFPQADNSEAIRIAASRAEVELACVIQNERAFLLTQSWDDLSKSLTNALSTSLPDGTFLKASDHLFLGISTRVVDDRQRLSPVMLHRPILAEHVHILGGTGSGKTSLGIMPILIQLIRGHVVGRMSDSERSDPQPIVVLDLKGDNALFHSVREEAERRGQEFLYFTVDSKKSSHYFNPFQALRRHGTTPSAQAQQLLDALSMNHGESYGRSYFTRVNRKALLEVLRSHGTPQSLKELYQRLISKRPVSAV